MKGKEVDAVGGLSLWGENRRGRNSAVVIIGKCKLGGKVRIA